MTEITLYRELGDGTVTSKENWKDLISSLALTGYEVYADDERIVFTLGYDDLVTEKYE